jgi:predicted PurR-regulated permease PerM
MIQLLVKLAPAAKREDAPLAYLEIDRRLGVLTRLKFIMAFAIGAVLATGFYHVGLNYWLLVVLAIAVLIAVREFQSYVINPHVVGHTVGLSPLVTLVTVAVVGLLFGALAVILAIPAVSAAATLIDVLALGKEPPPKPPPRRRLLPHRSGS